MSAKKTFLMTFVLLGACALVAGCGSESVSPTVDEAPILPPQNLVAGPSGNSAIMISWDANTQSKLAGYNVYRLHTVTLDLVKLTATPITSTTYLDNTIKKGVAYEYRITSVSTNGKESAYVSITALLEEGRNPDPDKMEL